VRQLFIVLAKIVGLLNLLQAMINLMGIFRVWGLMEQQPEAGLAMLVGYVFVILMQIALVYVLLVRTEWLAGRVGLEPEPSIHLQRDEVLFIGIKLIGLYWLASALPSLISGVAVMAVNYHEIQNQSYMSRFRINWDSITPAALRTVFALLLIFLTQKISRLICWKPAPVDEFSDEANQAKV